MPELHLQHTGDQLSITFNEYTSTVAWADVASWTPEQVYDDAESYGRALFEHITQNMDLRNALLRLRKNERLVLVAEQPDVAAVPWEYLRFPVDSQLSNLLLATRFNLVRGIAESERRDRVVPETPLTIVAVPVSPVDQLQGLNTEREWRNLGDMVKKRDRALTLTRVRPPTLAAMGRALSGEGTNIVQFMGHSGVVEGNGVLAFEDDLGHTKAANGILFANSLNEQTFLVVLNSCYSAAASGGNTETHKSEETFPHMSNISQTVVREGVPYALGMQFALLDSAALEITDVLYESLLQGRGIEESVRLMRADLEQRTMLPKASWLAGVPVLYTNLRESASALKLDSGQPTIVPDPIALTETRDLSVLSQAEHFVGRGEQISEALSVLLNASARGFVVLQGFGGIGKTTLARVIAERVSWYYQDRVLAYSFESFARFDYEHAEVPASIDTQFAERFYSRLASFYGLDLRQYTETRALQNAILQRRTYMRSLLVLDNIETLIYAQKNDNADAQALASFISRLKEGDSPILLTTRAMPPNDWGQRKEIHLSGLPDDIGAELFLSSLLEERRRFTTPETRKALSHYVKGHPLCIRLLAGRFSDDNADDLATFLKDIQNEIVKAEQTTPSSSDDPRRHATIRDCLNYSIRRLAPELATVLYTIGIFRAPFLLEYAEFVLDDEEQTKKYLQDLVRLGLLERTHVALADGQFDIYELHPMLRLHIQANINALNIETRKRYGDVFANLARKAWGNDGGYDQSASTRYLLLQSLPDCEAVLEEESIEAETRSALAYHLAKPYERMGQVQHALQLYEASLKVYQDVGDIRSIAVTQGAMADLLRQQGRVGEAMGLYEASLKTKQELGDMREIAVTQGAMADLLAQQGRVGEAMGLYEASLKVYQDVGDIRSIAVTQTNFGSLLWQQGEYAQALTRVWSAYKSLPESDFPRDVRGIQGILIGFKQHFSEDKQQFDTLWQQVISEPQPDWLLTVQAGSSSEDESTEETQEPSEEFQAIVAFVNAENWDATRQVVETQQEVLFRSETERVFEQVIEQMKVGEEQRVVEKLETHLVVLRMCKTDGIEVTFARIK